MKVLYLTVPSFFDLEISLIRELRKYCDVHVLMIISPESIHSSAFDIHKLCPEPKIINGQDFEEINKYQTFIDLKYWNIANNPDNSFISCFKLAKQIKEFIKTEEFDLIHSTTDCKTSVFLLPFIFRFKNTLFTEHDPIPHHKMNRFREFISYNLSFICFKNVLLLSDSLLEQFKGKFKGYYKTIYQSGLSIYDFLKSYPKVSNKYGDYILFFGRIDRYKGVDLLINAYRQSNAYKKGIKLIIAGRANSDFSVPENNAILLFNRYIPNEELAGLIDNSLFVVLPYKSATQSGCVFSAFAFDKPILATNVGDIPKQVNNNTGCLIEPNDVVGIKEGINYMLHADYGKLTTYIHNLYSDKGERSWGCIAKHLVEDIYNKIVKGE